MTPFRSEKVSKTNISIIQALPKKQTSTSGVSTIHAILKQQRELRQNFNRVYCFPLF
jgi:hypothetical protein